MRAHLLAIAASIAVAAFAVGLFVGYAPGHRGEVGDAMVLQFHPDAASPHAADHSSVTPADGEQPRPVR